jgi:hypothetical protein
VFSRPPPTGNENAIKLPLGTKPNYTDLQQLSFDYAGEEAARLGATLKLDKIGLKDVTAMAWFVWGWDAFNPTTNAPLPNEQELDLALRRQPTDGRWKGLSVWARYADVFSTGVRARHSARVLLHRRLYRAVVASVGSNAARAFSVLKRTDRIVMARAVSIACVVALIQLATTANASSDSYEATHPPRLMAAPADATSFYLEFRARDDVGGFGHSYVMLGAIDASNREHRTLIAGFVPRSADDDYWSKFGLPVTGLIGVTRSDFVRPPNARFRILINKATYLRVIATIHSLGHTWTGYELVVHNCNSFVGEIARSVGLRAPLITVQYPVQYVAELRALNSYR